MALSDKDLDRLAGLVIMAAASNAPGDDAHAYIALKALCEEMEVSGAIDMPVDAAERVAALHAAWKGSGL